MPPTGIKITAIATRGQVQLSRLKKNSKLFFTMRTCLILVVALAFVAAAAAKAAEDKGERNL